MATDSYAGLANHYDLLMTSGYYDYDRYATAIVGLSENRRDLLELGVGTGLVCEKILDRTRDRRITGIDASESMLEHARHRLGDRVHLQEQDILSLSLNRPFDIAYSVGGIWAFTKNNDDVRMNSFLPTDQENLRALENVRHCLRPGGLLLIAGQRPHVDFRQRLSNGMTYKQQVHHEKDGLLAKDYWITDGETTVAHQRSRFRAFHDHEAERLLTRAGFRADGPDSDGVFHRFTAVAPPR